ncbi:hypothetical protein CV102_19390 [Natronococcus pandeyae]|uniref:PRC-barrel domain-containing protein n=1 Tax=Natronococcus pandeyae TaxID=2055836 RepID=A0A8J8TQP9_9EURY|nr:PRC-barrel domain-containing protein [Natronococcus pandeyae]TYL36924.1 hypothetical protein CV102_19390 [Natronococcus pandeyae]
MRDILARDLQEKSIVGTDGRTFGTLYNITMDPDSGMLRDLVVDPHESKTTADTDDGRYRIPIGRVKTVRDQIIIDTD